MLLHVLHLRSFPSYDKKMKSTSALIRSPPARMCLKRRDRQCSLPSAAVKRGRKIVVRCVLLTHIVLFAWPLWHLEEIRAQDVSPCSYRECALRIERGSGIFGRTTVVRGVGAEKVATIGYLSTPNLTDLFARSDAAARYFRDFRSAHVRGNLLLTLGGLLAGAAVLIPEAKNEGLQFALLGVSVSGIVVYHFGDSLADRAGNSLARAIWWYNYELLLTDR